jgi:hypothetical protein
MKRLLVFALALSLAACAGATKTTRLDPPTRPGGRLCTIQCAEAKDHCAEKCHLDERACTNKMQQQAIQDYDAYTREQFVAHQPTEFLPRDFERPEKCKPVACLDTCETQYESCFVTCGGKIETESSCVAFCF